MYDIFTPDDRFLLRIPKEKSFDEKNVKERESYALHLLKGSSFAPDIVLFDGSRTIVPFQYTILHYEEGTTHKVTSETVSQITHIFRQVHNTTFDSWGFSFPPNYSPYVLSEYIRIRLWNSVNHPTTQNIVSLLHRYNSYFHLKHPSLVHGDINENQIIQAPDGSLKVIDWELAHVASPAIDIAALFVKHEFTQEMRETFFSQYKSGYQFLQQEVEIFSILHLVFWINDTQKITPEINNVLRERYDELKNLLKRL